MAHTLSAQKRVRQGIKRRRRNKHVKSLVKGAIKSAEPENGKVDAAAIRAACTLVDKAAAKGVIHRNTAGRRKSQLMRSAAARPAAPAK